MKLAPLVKPFEKFVPFVQSPGHVKIDFMDKAKWTVIVLLIFLVCCQVPLYGVRNQDSADPIYWLRMVIASNRGTLMELGITPMVTSSMVMQLLAGNKFFVWGMYGTDLGLGNSILIVVQLCFAGLLIMLLDEMMQAGYGLGSGISLFIATNICESIVWKAFSPTTINTGTGPQFEGAIIAFFHFLFTKSNKLDALYLAFFRSNLPNLTNLIATVIIFLVVIHFQSYKRMVPLRHTRSGKSVKPYPIPLFYTSNIPIILQTALVTNWYFFSQLLYKRFPTNFFVSHIIGSWETFEGRAIPVSGLAYYVSPPRSLWEFLTTPIHTIIYLVFVLGSCAVFSVTWLQVSGNSAKDVAARLKKQQLVIGDKRDASTYHLLKRYINTAAALGGMCIGALTVFADVLGAVGSGTGILLAVSIIFQYYESYAAHQAGLR